MSYKENLHDPISQADWRLKAALTKLAVRFQWQQLIILRATRPEVIFDNSGGKRYAVYLDGDAVHRGKQLEKDDEIDLLLDKLHVTPLRYSYHAPMSKTKLNEVALEIAQLSQG